MTNEKDEALRLECLKLALPMGGGKKIQDILRLSDVFFVYVKHGAAMALQQAAEPGLVKMSGPAEEVKP